MKVDAGSTSTVFDNVRIVKATRAPRSKSAVFAEDFGHFETTIDACISGESRIGIKKIGTGKSAFILDNLVILSH